MNFVTCAACGGGIATEHGPDHSFRGMERCVIHLECNCGAAHLLWLVKNYEACYVLERSEVLDTDEWPVDRTDGDEDS